LADRDVTSIRLVMNPEKMVIEEARRAYTYLQLYGYGVDAAVVNRVLPEDEGLEASVFGGYLQSQRRYLEEIENTFAPLPILRVPHLGEEVFGLDRLSRIADGMYDGRAPADRFYDEPTFKVEEGDDEYRVAIRLPFADEQEVDTRQFGDQLVVQVGNQRRNYVLPNFLGYYTLAESYLADGWLHVYFEKDASRADAA
jgi:arsenite-transporting ATPase